VGYQFQLSMSDTFRENAIFYNTNGLTTPVAAPSLVLPWITGSPHSLYARVRATTNGGDVTPWTEWGFDVVAPAPPKPLASDPGLLRWTPVEGATGYQVWLIDVPQGGTPGLRKISVHTNVLDEREFYTFHQNQKWIGTVRWRVRAERSQEVGGPTNKLPVATYGAWSDTYSSTNTAIPGGKIKLLHSTSDIVSDWDDVNGHASPAHRLMSGFTWAGTQALAGTSAELYRLYVFTDKQCLNPVFVSGVIGSPAYAPRPYGGLSLPTDTTMIGQARGQYLEPGSDPNGEMYDGTSLTLQESIPAATPTTTAPADQGPAGSAAPAPAPAAGGAAPPAAGSGAPGALSPGAPVDLWDTYPTKGGGYYWTVVAVAAVSSSAGASTVAAPGASKGSQLLPVTDTTQFKIGQSITIGVAPNSDTATIGAIGNGLVTLNTALNNGHAVGDPIASTSSGTVIYRDLELPQDVCATPDPNNGNKPRVQRLGIMSAPPLHSAQEPFATGLSKNGTLISADETGTFYGHPLVAWDPSLSADRYQVQWSKKQYPFTPDDSIMTPSTAVILPLKVGTWYYRVRGFDYNLPTDSQMLSWTDVARLDIAAPTFSVTPAPKKKFKIIGNKK
jgi:hypothetical protein